MDEQQQAKAKAKALYKRRMVSGRVAHEGGTTSSTSRPGAVSVSRQEADRLDRRIARKQEKQRRDDSPPASSKPGAVSVSRHETVRVDQRNTRRQEKERKASKASKPGAVSVSQLERNGLDERIVRKETNHCRETNQTASIELSGNQIRPTSQNTSKLAPVVATPEAGRDNNSLPCAHHCVATKPPPPPPPPRSRSLLVKLQEESMSNTPPTSKKSTNEFPNTLLPGGYALDKKKVSSTMTLQARSSASESSFACQDTQGDCATATTKISKCLPRGDAKGNTTTTAGSIEQIVEMSVSKNHVIDENVLGQDSAEFSRGAPQLEHGNYYYGIKKSDDTDEGLAVAVPIIEEKEEDIFIPSAVEFDPDSKAPTYRTPRFRLYACIACLALVGVAIGAFVGVLLAKGGDIEEIPSPAPTTAREGLGIRSSIERMVGNDVLASPSSPYSKALKWMIDEDPQQLLPEAPNFFQRYLCVYLYYATTLNRPWKFCNPPDTNETSFCNFKRLVTLEPEVFEDIPRTRWLSNLTECDWAGNFCDELGTLISIELVAVDMNGPCPEGIKFFPFLEQFNFGWNALTGTLPASWVDMKHLIDIEVQSNAISGSIPSNWWEAPNMQRINVASNKLTGAIPSEFGLGNILGLHLSDNSLTGTLPTEIGLLTSLLYFRVSMNGLKGTVPTEIGQLTNLEELWIQSNNFTGQIPTQVGLLTSIIDFRIHKNVLSGKIPVELFNARNIERLDMYVNALSGTIPSSISRLENLDVLRIWQNELTGTIPSELGMLTGLEVVSLYENKLTGQVPQELCQRRQAFGTINRADLSVLEVDCANSTETGIAEVSCAEGCCTYCCNAAGDCFEKA